MPLVDNAWYIDFGNGTSTGYYAVTAWSTGATKVCGNLIRPLTAPAVNSERLYVCIASTSGTGTTGGAEPTWTFTRGVKITDNTVTWQEATGIAALNGDLSTNTPTWTTVKNTAIVLGQVIQNVAGTLVLICTTAGTAGNGAEPSWAAFTNAGATTADNTATWTTLGASFSAWAAPHARLFCAYANTWGQVSNSFFVASEHAETQASTINTAAPAGSASAITTTYCVNKSNVPPGSANLTTGASVNATGASNVTLNGINAYFYGLTLNAGSGSSTGNITLGNAGAGTYENCTIALNNTSTSSLMNFSNTGVSNQFKNCTFSLGNASQQLTGVSGSNLFQNMILAGTAPTTLITRAGTNVTYFTIKGSDLSSVTGTLVGSYGGVVVFSDCKLAGGVTVATGSTQNGYIDLIRCDSGATNYRNERYRVSGAQTTETTIIRTGGATDGTTPISWKIVTSAGSRWVFPFECQPTAIWNTSTSAITTLTIYGTTTGGGVPNNDDVWVEVEYPGSGATPLSSFITTTKTDNLAPSASTNNSSDASTWGGGGAGNGFKIVVPSFTPAMAGPLYVVIHVAKISSTYYIDPLPVIN